MRITLIAAALAASAALAGCASLPGLGGGYGDTYNARTYPNSAGIYAAGGAQRVQRVQLGTVLAVQPVTIDAPPSRAGLGTALGAGAGGLIGNQIGHGGGKTIATVAGAIGGALAGSAIAGRGYKQAGLQITVQLDNRAGTVAVTQNADVPVRVGQRVEIIGNGYGSPARVEPLQ